MGNRNRDNKRLVVRYLTMVAAAVAAGVTVLAVFKAFSLYPFGDRTAAWCDMNQQVVPLLCQFKDILDGKSGMFLSFKNASGMNFWGVFFFFLASPFSFLVKFVDKSDMLVFANILIVAKIMTSAATASLYFVRSPRFKKLGFLSITMLGYIYALSGYVMLFYQNVIWLDVMYLFPLLMISLERIMKKGKPLMYILLMALMIVVNYYIGYMTVVFVLLFAGTYAAYSLKTNADCGAQNCLKFLVSSAVAALVSAVVWLPCFLQYLTSGRRSSLLENLRTASLVTDYDTVFPVLMCSSALILLVFADTFLTKHDYGLKHRFVRVLALLLALPLVFEPVNKMWHTGSYMSFPARYAFMTVFMLLILAAYELDRRYKYRDSMVKYAVGGVLCAVAVFAYKKCTDYYIEENQESLAEYTKSLGGSETSFKGLLRLLIIGLICAAIIYIFYRRGWIIREIFLVFLCALTVLESAGNVRIYMTSAGVRNEATNALQREVFDLADKVTDDDSFYRVKTSAKIFDYNMIGAMGYNSIGHYTSLTDEDYMFTMKRMGYTSVWMEVGTCGGTPLTDALLSVGYEICHEKTDDTIYSFSGYYINTLDYKLPLGVVAQNLSDSEEIPEELTRAQVQEYIYENIFGDENTLVSEYQPEEGEYELADGVYTVKEDEQLIYRIDVSGEQTLYFDCFDELSNELSEPIYDSFQVSVNGQTVERTYPYSKVNGVLNLGTFTDEKVIIQVSTLKDVSCASFGVFGMDNSLLAESCDNAQGVGFTEVTNGLTGSITTDSEETIFLAVPYDSGFEIKVNGKNTDYRMALSGFIAFEVGEGENDIEISFTPSGFRTGAVISVIGIAAGAVYFYIDRRASRNGGRSERLSRVNEISRLTVIVIGVLVFAAVYIMPMVVNILFWQNG